MLVICMTIGLSSCHQDRTQSMFDELDKMIANKHYYDKQKENKIIKLKHFLSMPNLSPVQQYSIDSALCNEYKKYQVDSALVYAIKCEAVTKKMNNKVARYYSIIQLAQSYNYIGMSLEALNILKSIPVSSLTPKLLTMYYIVYRQYYEYYAAITNTNKYTKYNDEYVGLMLKSLDKSSFRYIATMADIYEKRPNLDSAKILLDDLMRMVKTDSPEYAETTFMMGYLNQLKGRYDMEIKYYVLSAIADIKNSTKENASFRFLAIQCYKRGDYSRAARYAHSAMEDAVFSNLPFRKIQMVEFYPIINASQQKKEADSKRALQLNLIAISILSTILALSFIYVYVQLRKLSRIRKDLSDSNAELERLNTELNERNYMLSDSNAIKEQYIARFFDLCSVYIEKLDEYRKSLKKLMMNKQLDELYNRLNSTSLVEDEVEQLYKKFDVIFLDLYPSFVTDFNSLLQDGEHIELKHGELLNKELRIYALLRLGITDSIKISSFLRCSLSTIYNYKTKIRNKAAVPKDKFESIVMKIGIKHENSL
jgi:cell division protein FtsB